MHINAELTPQTIAMGSLPANEPAGIYSFFERH